MKIQRLLSLVRQAIEQYHMIEDGDRIAVGISGGKDCLTLLYAMHELQKFYPKHFELCAVSVDLGFNMDYTGVQTWCSQLGIHYEIIRTQIYDIVFHERKESNPCSLCAKMRKGALNQYLLDIGYHKVVYAHHMDDVIETLIMSLVFEGRINTFAPVTLLEKTGITVIRPMIYVNEAQVRVFARNMQLPVVKNLCPADGYTKREYVKEMIAKIESDHPGAKQRIFTAIEKGTLPGWS